MEVIIDSSVIFDSLEEIDYFLDIKKKKDRIAIEKVIDLKQNKRISCIRTINSELEIAKDNRQKLIKQRWGTFTIRDRGIGIKATLKNKYYNPGWDQRFNELKGARNKDHVDASMLVQAESFNIKYILSTDYDFIKRSRNKSKIVEVLSPVDFLKINKL